jgi:acetyltransferase
MTTFSNGGETLVIRPIRAADFELERAFVRGLSAQTGALRLMSPRAPSDDELRRWTDVDQQREVALIAVTVGAEKERAVGVARYVVDDTGKAAEFAIVLRDAWQHRGLGRALLTELIAHARQAGLRQLFGPTLSENAAMIGLARSLGFSARRKPGEASITNLTLELG